MKLIITLLSLLTFSSILLSQNFILTKNTSKSIELEFKNEQKAFEFTTIENQNYIDFSKSYKVTTLEKGNPCLPSFGESFVIPNKGISAVNYTFDEILTFENVLIAPSKGNLKRNVNPADIAYTFGNSYSENAFFPSQIAKLNDPFILRSIRGQVLTIVPFQYNPVSKTLKVYTNLKVKITFDSKQTGINELNASEVSFSDAKSYQNIFANQISVSKYAQVEEDGELLVITTAEYKDSIKSLLDWKHQKGIKVSIKILDASISTASEVKTYIQDFYTVNPQLKYILLVGDHQQVPSYSYGTSLDGETLTSDSYFGQLTADYYPELFVGRFSGSSSQITVMVKRGLEYEKNPLSGDWMTKAIGLGSSQGAGYGDDNEADWQHLRGIKNQLTNFGYTEVFEFYDGSRGEGDANGNPVSSIISPAVNAGIGLFNYTGHGDINTCITGNFGSTQINLATNNGKYPFVISVACNNGTFINGNCISETWLRATENNTPSGAIAACGSSILMAWAPPMQTQDELANLITEQDVTNKKSTLGGIFYNAQMSMLENYPQDGEEVMQTWVLFGDPTVEFRSKVTQNLNVSHVASTFELTQANLEFFSGTEGALISLTQDSIFIGKALINGGICTITIPELTNFAPITVTATKQNYKPYSGTINLLEKINSISELKNSGFSVYPNPSSKVITISSTEKNNYTYILTDLKGKVISSEIINQSKINNLIDVSAIANGIYTLTILEGENVYREKIVVSK